METKVFRSRISVLLMLFMIVPFSFPIVHVASYDPQHILVLFAILLPILLFIVIIFTSTKYSITGHSLQISCCIGKPFTFDVNEICLIERSYNPLSSPAAALKRLAVYTKRELGRRPKLIVLISPVREQEFLETLKAINPNVRINVDDKKGWWRIWDLDI